VPEVAWLDPEGRVSPSTSMELGSDGEAEKDEKKSEKENHTSKAKEAEAGAERERHISGSGSHSGGDRQGESQHVSFSARIPGTTVPAFRSFAVTRAYRLRVKVVVEACGKEFEVGGESQVGGLWSC
jgi:hypothetical protein